MGPGSFRLFNAEICILPHPRDSFPVTCDIQLNIQNLKNSTLYINHFEIFL